MPCILSGCKAVSVRRTARTGRGMSMSKTMKAAVVREYGKALSIEQVPVPQPGEGQILVKIAASGVCHTDIHAADGDWPVKPTLPLIPGHEGVGHVAGL